MLDIVLCKKYNQYLCSVPEDFCLEFRANYKSFDKFRGVLTVRPEVPAYDAMLVYCTFPYSQNRQCWGVKSVKELPEGTSLLLQSAPYMESWTNYSQEITLSIPGDARIIQHTRYARATPRIVYMYVGGTELSSDSNVQEEDKNKNQLTLFTPTIVDKIYLPGQQTGLAQEPSINGNGATMPTASIARIYYTQHISHKNLMPYTGTITIDKKTGQILSRQAPKYSFKTLRDTIVNDKYYKKEKEQIQERGYKAYEIAFKANRFDLASRATQVTLRKNGIFFGKGLVNADVDLLHPLESVYTITEPGWAYYGQAEVEFTVPWDSTSINDDEIVRMIIQHKIKEHTK